MDRQLTGIDHLIVGVRDLEAARERFARLGFNSTPRGRHAGWGTANYCIMLEADYLELLGIVDATAFTNGLDRFLERCQGLLGVVVGSRDAALTRAAWEAEGATPEPVRELGRLLELEGDPVELRFRNVMLPPAATAGLNLFACQHLTPERLRRPGWLVHPNGARAIRSCTVAAADTAPVEAALRRLFGAAAITRTDQIVAAHTGRGVILLAPLEDAQLIHPHADLADGVREPRLVAATLTVADPDRTAAFLRLQGIPHRRGPNGDVLVPAAEANGVALEFASG